MTNTPNEMSEDVRAAGTSAATQLKFDGPKINMELVKEITEQMTGSVQSHDMFFSCCDWEAAMEAEKKGLAGNTNKSGAENFSDSDEASTHKTCENKRNRKMAEKTGQVVSRFEDQDQFDVDLVMKKVPCPNSTEKIVSTKKYFSSKSKKRHGQKRRHELCSQGSSSSSQSHGEKKQAEATSLSALYNSCLSPMGNKSRHCLDLSQHLQNTI